MLFKRNKILPTLHENSSDCPMMIMVSMLFYAIFATKE